MWCLVLFLKVTKQIEKFHVTSDLVFVVDLLNSGWYFKKRFEKRGFLGFGFGNTILIKDCDFDRYDRTLIHEITHVFQCYRYGVIFPLAYIIECGIIYFFKPEKHSYYDNRFEIEARKSAGQDIEIPKEKWLQGPKDRWIFW